MLLFISLSVTSRILSRIKTSQAVWQQYIAYGKHHFKTPKKVVLLYMSICKVQFDSLKLFNPHAWTVIDYFIVTSTTSKY